MHPSKAKKPRSSQYEPLSLSDNDNYNDNDNGEGSDTPLATLFSSEDLPEPCQSPPQPAPLLVYLSLALALVSAVNMVLFPAVLSEYRAHPFSISQLAALPYGDARLGLDKVAHPVPSKVYHHAWPDRIVRVSRKLKKAVWGQGVQVYVTVEVRSSLFPRLIPPFAPVSLVSLCSICSSIDACSRIQQLCASPSPRLLLEALTPALCRGDRLPSIRCAPRI